MILRKRCHKCVAFWRVFHIQNGRKLAHVGRGGIFGELTYHVAEVMGSHDALLIAAGALVIFTMAKIASGEL